jgi:predicted thioesterase
MEAEQLLGAVGMASLTVRPLDTGVAQGLNDLPVLAANSALNVIESACSAAIAEHFQTGETSFTIGAAIQMRGAVSIGAEVRALVKATELNENILTFECEVHQEKRIIAVAQVQRRLVDRVSFMARSAAENLPRNSAAS